MCSARERKCTGLRFAATFGISGNVPSESIKLQEHWIYTLSKILWMTYWEVTAHDGFTFNSSVWQKVPLTEGRRWNRLTNLSEASHQVSQSFSRVLLFNFGWSLTLLSRLYWMLKRERCELPAALSSSLWTWTEWGICLSSISWLWKHQTTFLNKFC